MTLVPFFCFIILVLQGTSEAIQITKLVIPKALVVGDSTWLNCTWKEDNDHVYTLKWYLGLHEFYRWTPAEEIEDKVFPLPSAFQIDQRKSRRGRVWIHNVTQTATGTFRCEISGEAPFFKTSFQTATLTVYDLPDQKPMITGIQPTYRLQDEVNINCTSFRAKPLPELKFYINNNVADPEWIIHYPEVMEANGLKTITRGLKLNLQSINPNSRRMKIKCTSKSPLYFESEDKVLNIDLPYYYPVTSDFLPDDEPIYDYGDESSALPTKSCYVLKLLISVVLLLICVR